MGTTQAAPGEALALSAFGPGVLRASGCPMGPVGAAHRVRLPTPLSLHSLENLGPEKRLSKFSEGFDLF